jgi:hypothetical protein
MIAIRVKHNSKQFTPIFYALSIGAVASLFHGTFLPMVLIVSSCCILYTLFPNIFLKDRRQVVINVQPSWSLQNVIDNAVMAFGYSPSEYPNATLHYYNNYYNTFHSNRVFLTNVNELWGGKIYKLRLNN